MKAVSNVKKDVVQWFVKNILAPNFVRFDVPGFILTTKNGKGEDIGQRDIFLSEKQVAQFEERLVKELGNEGKLVSYSIGKNHGHAYAHSFDIPRLGISNEKEIDDFVPFFIGFMGATWGNSPKCRYDIKEKTLELEMADHIVCRKNGLGYMLTAGALGGGWQYIMQDETVEGTQIECAGNRGAKCWLVCGPAKYLEQKKYPFLRAEAKTQFEIDTTYNEMNKIRQLQHSKTSLKNAIEGSIFRFQDSRLTFHGERYFFAGIELHYVIEMAAMKNPKVAQILSETAFEHGMEIASQEKGNEYSSFIPDFLAALGFGDTVITQSKGKFAVQASYFPWLPPYAEINYTYYKGLLSGMLSGFTGKKVELRKHNTNVSAGYLILEIE